jgi:hypothetical protein
MATESVSAHAPFIQRYVIFVALLLPLLLAVAGSLGKKLVRGTPFRRSDLFLGLDLTLGALSAGLVNLLDLAKDAATVPNLTATLFFTAGYIATTFFFFLIILTLHQAWEKRENEPLKQILCLGVASNGIGLSLLLGFVWLKLSGNA